LNHIDLTEVEREICRLPDVSIARIVGDDADHVTEVHVVAREGKHPKQIARDVQSIALASFGLQLDRRIVSVVQLGANGGGGASISEWSDPRAAIVGIIGESSGVRSLVRVTLVREGSKAVGFAEGSVATTARHRLVASATIDALRQLERGAGSIDLEDAQIVRVSAHDIALVTVVFMSPPTEQVVVGSALVGSQPDVEAIARAVLDATNRRLAWHRPTADDFEHSNQD
jgi:hypothetical protein